MKKILTLVLSLICFSFILVPSVQAKVIVQEKGLVTIPAAEIINDDLFIAAESVNISGTVNGDVYIAAGTVAINQAIIGDSLIIAAGNVTIDGQTKIGGSLIAGTGNLDNQASVGRNFMVAGGMIRLNAPVKGEIRVASDELILGSKTKVNGNLTYMTNADLIMDEATIISGTATRVDYPRPEKKLEAKKAWPVVSLVFNIFAFFCSLVVGLVLLWLFSKPAQAVAEKIKTKFGSSLGWGLVMLFVVPPTLFLLACTGIGFSLALIGGLLFILDLYLAKIFAALALGKIISQRFGWTKLSIFLVFSLGLFSYCVLQMIPVIGVFVRLIGLLTGLGAVWLYQKQLWLKK